MRRKLRRISWIAFTSTSLLPLWERELLIRELQDQRLQPVISLHWIILSTLNKINLLSQTRSDFSFTRKTIQKFFLIKRIKTLFNDVKSEELRYWIFNLFHLAARNFRLTLSPASLPLHWFEIKNSHRESSQWGLISFLLFQCLHRPRATRSLQLELSFISLISPFSPFISSQTVAHKKSVEIQFVVRE